MKRFNILSVISLILAVSLCLSALTACGGGNKGGNSTPTSAKTSASQGGASASDQGSDSSDPQEVKLSHIEITALPDKTDYLKGEYFDETGMVVTAFYTDGTSAIVSNYGCTPFGALSESDDKITVTYSEKGVEKTAYVDIIVGSVADETARAAAIEAVCEAFDKLDKDDYSEIRFNRLIETLNSALRAIKNASTAQGIEQYKNDAIIAFKNAVTKGQALEGTIVNTYTGKYEFDKDENGNLLIQYLGYPGSWVYVGNKSLGADVKKQNLFVFKVRNNYNQNIKIMLKLTDGADYEVGTDVVTLKGLETREFRVSFTADLTRMYFFVDSCDTHERSGEVAILDAHFEFDQSSAVETELYPDKTVTFNKTIDADVAAEYTLTADDHPRYVERVDVLGQVNYNGNPNNKQYFGIRANAGSAKETFSDGVVHTATIDGGIKFCFTIAVDETAKLNTGAVISAALSYFAEGLTFKIEKFVIHYTEWDAVSVEKLTLGDNEGIIYENGARVEPAFEVSYDRFANKGRVLKADIEFVSVNSETYSKSQIYIRGLTFNGGIGNNVLNISSIMEKSNGTTPVTKTGTMTVYPTDDKTDLNSEGNISFDCWWSSGTYIKVKSITLYTVSMEAASPVENLTARGLDSSVYLSWDKDLNATQYVVYLDGSYYATTAKTYCLVTGLDNGVEYEFTVEAKNAVGTAQGVKVKGTPEVGETFDAFIDSVNEASNLESLIGIEKLQVLYDNCVYSDGNNARLKGVLEKMSSGISQTICYVGGSITVGENATLKDGNHHQKGYAYYSYQWLKDTFDSAGNSKYVNASISGTGSEIGIVRAQKDIYDHEPDLIFIEFGANNSSTDLYRNTYEGMIRNCLNLPSNPAVVVVISCTTYTHGSRAVKYMYEIGQYYDLPIFTIDQGLYELCDGDISTKNQYFKAFISDGTHPNDEGHVLYGKCLASFLRKQATRSTDASYTVKTAPLYSSDYDNFVSVDSTNAQTIVKSMGSFVAGDTATTCTSKQSDVTAFQQGFKKTSTTENEAMVIEVSCKNFIIIVCNTNPGSNGSSYVYGTLSVKVTNLDTNTVVTQTKDIGPKGWDNCVAMSVIEETSSSNYRIEISFTAASGVGNIFAMGYTA